MTKSRPIPSARILGPLVAGLIGAVTTGCGHGESEAKGHETAAPRIVAVTVAPVEHRSVERTIEVVGTLRGWEQLSFGSKRTGRVLKVLHDMGDFVKPGELLIELDPIDAQLSVKQAEAKYMAELVRLGITAEQADSFVKRYGLGEALMKAQVTEEVIEKAPSVVQMRVSKERATQNLARQRNLFARNASTQQELDDYENTFRESSAAYENARYLARNLIANAVTSRVALDQARQALEETQIRAPVPALVPPGTGPSNPVRYGIAKRMVSEGQMIKEGEAVAELVIEDPVRLWSSVPESFSGRVKIGQKTRVSVPSHPGRFFEGRVSRINPSVDTVSRTFQVEAILPNKEKLLRPGGFAKASLVTDEHATASVVPIESIGQFAGVTKLFIVQDGKARAITDLTLGVEGRGWIEVVSQQLPKTAQVVITGQTQLAEGTQVMIRDPAKEAEADRSAGAVAKPHAEGKTSADAPKPSGDAKSSPGVVAPAETPAQKIPAPGNSPAH